MGRRPDPWNEVLHSDFWKEVRKISKYVPRIRLRPAANLVGMFQFPNGWLSTEYDPILDEDICDFEAIWRDECRRPIPGRSLFGERLARNAHEFRRGAVEEILKWNLKRGKVAHESIYIHNPKAPAYGRKPPEYPINPIEFEGINVALSTVGRLVSRQHAIRVDKEDLLNCLIAEHENRGRKSRFDRDAAERIARERIEAWDAADEKALTKEAIINAVADPQFGIAGTSDGDVASNDQVRPVVDELWKEYGLGE